MGVAEASPGGIQPSLEGQSDDWHHTSKCRLTFSRAAKDISYLCPACFFDSLLTPLPAEQMPASQSQNL